MAQKTPIKLQVTLPSKREISMSRVFDAPRELVFDAHTRPELVRQWLGVQNGWSLAVCEIDLKVGGAYRYLWRNQKSEMGMGGVFREITRPARLVATERFDEPWYPGDALDTTTFTENAGKTTLTITVLYASEEIRNAVLKSPMSEGMDRSFDKLVELLASLAAGGGK